MTFQQTQVMAAMTTDVFPEHSPDTRTTFQFVHIHAADERVGSIGTEDSGKATVSTAYVASQFEMLPLSVLPTG